MSRRVEKSLSYYRATSLGCKSGILHEKSPGVKERNRSVVYTWKFSTAVGTARPAFHHRRLEILFIENMSNGDLFAVQNIHQQ